MGAARRTAGVPMALADRANGLGFLILFLAECLTVAAANMEPIYWNSLNRRGLSANSAGQRGTAHPPQPCSGLLASFSVCWPWVGACSGVELTPGGAPQSIRNAMERDGFALASRRQERIPRSGGSRMKRRTPVGGSVCAPAWPGRGGAGRGWAGLPSLQVWTGGASVRLGKMEAAQRRRFGDERGYVLYPQIGDRLDLVCPGSSPAGPRSTPEYEYYKLYLVARREEADRCEVTGTPSLLLTCDKPNADMRFTIKFQEFSPNLWGHEFKNLHDYYIIASCAIKYKHSDICWCY
ncbi:hypothetical protein P4O66_000301 [Electrophorus voltai]|uniref:Ephrin RBD domain-containing protein n=1 Tax=Electrophorus voltai TaxID=2609070 RepID=A0AAD8ZMN9_9TELE|nr:hypothetical protein P4O66_000301 [Electrophorus voltai]